MTPAARDAIFLGWTLSAAHLGLSAVLFVWLIFGGGRGYPAARDFGWTVLDVMHFPLEAADRLALFAILPGLASLPAAIVLILAGSLGWGFLTAGLVVWARRAIRP